MGSFTDFDRLFDVLSLAADQAEDWEAQLLPVDDDFDEPEVYDIFGQDDDEAEVDDDLNETEDDDLADDIANGSGAPGAAEFEDDIPGVDEDDSSDAARA